MAAPCPDPTLQRQCAPDAPDQSPLLAPLQVPIGPRRHRRGGARGQSRRVGTPRGPRTGSVPSAGAHGARLRRRAVEKAYDVINRCQTMEFLVCDLLIIDNRTDAFSAADLLVSGLSTLAPAMRQARGRLHTPHTSAGCTCITPRPARTQDLPLLQRATRPGIAPPAPTLPPGTRRANVTSRDPAGQPQELSGCRARKRHMPGFGRLVLVLYDQKKETGRCAAGRVPARHCDSAPTLVNKRTPLSTLDP